MAQIHRESGEYDKAIELNLRSCGNIFIENKILGIFFLGYMGKFN